MGCSHQCLPVQVIGVHSKNLLVRIIYLTIKWVLGLYISNNKWRKYLLVLWFFKTVRMKKKAKGLCSHYMEGCKITIVSGAAKNRRCKEALINGILERNEYCIGKKRTGRAPIWVSDAWSEKGRWRSCHKFTIDRLQRHANRVGFRNGLESGRDPGTNCLTFLFFPSLHSPVPNYAKKFNEDGPTNQKEVK